MQLTQGLHRAARVRPSAIATIDSSRIRTWSEVRRDVMRFAGLLVETGIKPGDRVAVLAQNSDHFYDAYFAIFWAGAIIVPLNTRLSVAELAFQIGDVGAALLIHGDGFEDAAAALHAQFPDLKELAFGEAAGTLRARIANCAMPEDANRADQDVAGIFYTGGTTGLPKGVMLTHRNLTSVADNLIMMIRFSPACVNLHCAPMFHLADIGLFTVTMTAGTHVFAQHLDAATIMRLVEAHKVTHVFTVPAVIDTLARTKAGEHDLSSLKMLGYGGSPMPEATLARAEARFPGMEFVQGFGMTEMPSVTYLLPEDHRPGVPKLRSGGTPC